MEHVSLIFALLMLVSVVDAQDVISGGKIIVTDDGCVCVADKDSATIKAEAEAQEKAKKMIGEISADTLLVAALAKELGNIGAVCSVFGHHWRDGRPGKGGGLTFADYHPYTTFRTCTICGKCESADTRLHWK